MMFDKYLYLFPFEAIPKQSNILIYGAGDVGQEYFQQIQITKYCTCKAFIDRAYDKYPAMSLPIYAPTEISVLDFDYIVIAMKTANYISEIKSTLNELGVDKEKIVYVGGRISTIQEILCGNDEFGKYEIAPQKGEISIALKYGPGLGDCIVKKKFFKELVKIAPNCNIDIYAPNASKYIYSIYADEPNLNLVIDDGGFLYAQKFSKYTLAIKVFFLLQIDFFDEKQAEKVNKKFWGKINLLKKKCETYDLKPFPPTQAGIHFQRMKIRGENYYSSFSYDDVFKISDNSVNIPLDNCYKEIYEKLLLNGKYITINYGNGSADNNVESVAKQWPLEYFRRFVELYHERYPNVKIIQIGSVHAKKIIGCDQYELGQNLDVVKYILKNALFHLDIEGGLVHLASQLGTKCVVLFGPTPVSFFGYEQNCNILAGECHGCYCLYDNINMCARNLKKPECMYSISPEIVMEKLKRVVGEDI